MKTRLLLFIVVVGWMLPATGAATHFFGDVSVAIVPDLPEAKTHGVHETLWTVRNESTDRAHDVTLELPATAGFSQSSHEIHRVSRTVRVGPGETLRVRLPVPGLQVDGSGLRVSIDGRAFDTPVPWVSGMEPWILHSDPTSHEVQRILLGPGQQEADFRASVASAAASGETRFLRTPEPLRTWSDSWLAYSGYDGIVVGAEQLAEAPPAVRAALLGSVEAGGNLTVLGASDSDSDLLPGVETGWWPLGSGRRLHLGFGVVQVFPGAASELEAEEWKELEDSWAKSLAPWVDVVGMAPLQAGFGVAGDVTVPVRGLFLFIVAFAVVLGPVNLLVLSRRDRRIWLLATVPGISFLVTLMVVGWAMVGEGFLRLERRETLTVLDQERQTASTLGLVGVYATVTPGEGLHFSGSTEVTPIFPYSWGASGQRRSVDWTQGQHLASGWLSPRLPSYFAVRRHERRRQRLAVEWHGDELHVINGLGAPLEALWLADRTGRIHRLSGGLAAGEAGALGATRISVFGTPGGIRELYRADLTSRLARLREKPEDTLVPGSYLAVLAGSPFIEGRLPGAGDEDLVAVVLGRLSEGEG